MRFFRRLLRRVCLGAGAILCSPIVAHADVFLTCMPPAGQRAEFGTLFNLEGVPLVTEEDGVVWTADGFSNVYPIFFWRESEPDDLLFAWGDTRPARAAQQDIVFETAAVLYRDERQIQAALVKCGTISCTFSTFAVFPRLGFITRTDSYFDSLGRPGEGTGVTRVFASTCAPFGG